MKTKAFKGKIEVDEQITVRLGTNDGLTGYKIKKFQIISSTPGVTSSVEYVAKVYTVERSAVDALVDFNDPTLIAVVYYQDRANASSNTETIIIDNKIFNQDCYVTLDDSDGNTLAGNFYLELEQVKLDLNEATVATLKDMRGRE
tara:strand:- start:153 stop:587 length:435 start_codon:yes stop_codon:yes gene_type:complete